MKKNSLAEKNPELAKEWHPTLNGDLTPWDVARASNKKVWWQCGEGHEWKALVSGRSNGAGCPYCASQKVWAGYNDLATTNPELAKEWHPTLNGILTPKDFTCGSNHRVWWRCREIEGHQWESTIKHRNNGSGCLYCSHKAVLPGYNDLATINPTLAKEWHPTLNGDFLPEEVTYGSKKKVWWLCSKRHSWNEMVSSRNRGDGCPYCSNRKTLKGYNDLATVNPTLAKGWHPTLNGNLTPNDVIAGSGHKAWWICKEGHEWKSTIISRDEGGDCPYCVSRKILPGYNDLETVNPTLAKGWHPTLNGNLTPRDVFPSSSKKVWWQCDNHPEHVWDACVDNRNNGTGCPYCSNKQVLSGYNDLETTNPKLAKEWHPSLNGELLPRNIVFGSNKKVWWQCRKGHDWIAMIGSRHSGTGCPKCNGERQTSFPEQALCYYLDQIIPVENRAVVFGMELDVYIPSWNIGIEYDGMRFHSSDESIVKENQKNETLLKNGIQLIRIKESKSLSGKEKNIIYYVPDSQYKYLKTALVYLAEILSEMKGFTIFFNIDVKRDSIKIMERYIESEKAQSIAHRNPQLAEEWHPSKNGGLKPEQISFGSNKKVWWQCIQHKGHEWEANVCDRNKGSGCPYCSNKKILSGYNDLKTTNPKLVKEWHPTLNGDLTPSDVVCGSNKNVWWQCSKHVEHSWKVNVYTRNKGSGCPYCSNNKILSGFNDLITTHPEIAQEWHPRLNGDLTPADVTAGSSKKVWWQCSQSHEWQARLVERKRGRGHCRECRKTKRIQSFISSIKNDEPPAT